MQAASDKTFHLKWNNHLQNLSQLFTAIFSSSALADVTLACRDGTLRAHKLVLSACSPYFEQIFKDNPCKHPVVILKGIPFSEINLLVEFMYKGSVDVQEMDLQSLMHTASELEIRGLAYEVRANAAQLLNVNLEYPYTPPAVSVASTSSYDASPRAVPRTDMERLKQIHLYQQSMLREAERRKRREEPMPTTTTAAVKSILAAAAKELADGSRERTTSCAQTEEGDGAVKTELFQAEEETWSRPKKRVSIVTPEEEKQRKRRLQYEVTQSPQRDGDGGISKLRISAVTGAIPKAEAPAPGGIKVVQLSALQHQPPDHSDDEESGLLQERRVLDDEDTCSSGSASEAPDAARDARPHVCDICDIRFQRASHLNRHRLTHTGERPFTCGGCGKSFARSDKLRVHTKICEREDPTVDMAEEARGEPPAGDVTPGTVRITHRDSRQLMFTAGGDVMLAPRPPAPAAAPAHAAPEGETPAKRGRGRPKKPVTDVPKIKKRRGRPPKALSGTVPTLPPPETDHSDQYSRRKSLVTAMQNLAKLAKLSKHKKKRVMKTTKNDLAAAQNYLTNNRAQSGLVEGRNSLTQARTWNVPEASAPELDMMMGLGNGSVGPSAAAAAPRYQPDGVSTVPMQQHITPSGHQLLVKRKRGRPPKNYFQPRHGALQETFYEGSFPRTYKQYGRPKENYNATNLPFGDFSYLTEMMSYQGGLPYLPPHAFPAVTVDPERDVDLATGDSERDSTLDRTNVDSTPDKKPIDLSSSSSDEGTEDSRVDQMLEGDDTVPAAICETEIMTVGDCQILKVPEEGKSERAVESAEVENGNVSITPVTSIGDCTIRPVDNT